MVCQRNVLIPNPLAKSVWIARVKDLVLLVITGEMYFEKIAGKHLDPFCPSRQDRKKFDHDTDSPLPTKRYEHELSTLAD